MEIVHAHAAGIDIGSKSHWVAVDQDPRHVKEFGVYTKDHLLLIEYLHSHHIITVAMESTGSYWQTLFTTLQSAGFEVILVKGGNTKNVSGRKTDMLDCMWIQKLHTLGLLSASFILSEYLQTLRTYFGHREYLVDQTTRYINKMQKALRLMNIRLDIALRDIMGKTGRAIINAILNGDRDPHYLASLSDSRVKKSKVEIADSLQGEWRDDLLFELQSCLAFYDTYVAAIHVCDQKIAVLLAQYLPKNDQLFELSHQPERKPEKKKKGKFAPVFNVRQLAFAHFKTDLYEIPGVSHNTVLCILCTMGNEIHRFKTAKQFACWLGLVPNNKISGGKIITSRTPKNKSMLATCLRQAANSIGNQTDHPLTPFFKRIAFRKGRGAAITATARKLALVIWNMIIKSQSYKGYDCDNINQKRKNTQIKNIRRRLRKLNLSEEEMKALFSTPSSLSDT